jgi:hypothetical protein
MWAPVPQQPPMAGGMFMSWDKLWSTYERKSPGILILSWAHADGGYVTPPPRGSWVERLAQRARILMMTPEQVREILLSSREQMRQQRPGYQVRHERPRWGTFAQPDPPEPHANIGADWFFGWPRHCLWFQARGTVFDNTVRNPELRGAMLWSGAPSAVTYDFRALPLRLIWPGILINSIFYAALWMMTLIAPGMLRRRWRRRCGRCAACGYDLRGQIEARCPECGGGSESGLTTCCRKRVRQSIDHARELYEPSTVLMRTTSPIPMNGGTRVFIPVSSVASLS